jgi:hypothetical protein
MHELRLHCVVLFVLMMVVYVYAVHICNTILGRWLLLFRA